MSVQQERAYILSMVCDLMLFVDALRTCMGLNQSLPRLSAHGSLGSTDLRTNSGIEALDVADESCRDPL
jgi:hypothetical protein